ncbi:hypothetical protein IWQ60_001877 [Tieghemiomyces parasiticus]|uniref:Uncharacterized protein n=1 Tax=Tieghemiomyces parasiticus TaxID=78921 RepID=A0A9W8AKE4_9FUNG|nr:hypothetical protein IWQ60_001877 [Tieghemiomyces parasiticus]
MPTRLNLVVIAALITAHAVLAQPPPPYAGPWSGQGRLATSSDYHSLPTPGSKFSLDFILNPKDTSLPTAAKESPDPVGYAGTLATDERLAGDAPGTGSQGTRSDILMPQATNWDHVIEHLPTATDFVNAYPDLKYSGDYMHYVSVLQESYELCVARQGQEAAPAQGNAATSAAMPDLDHHALLADIEKMIQAVQGTRQAHLRYLKVASQDGLRKRAGKASQIGMLDSCLTNGQCLPINMDTDLTQEPPRQVVTLGYRIRRDRTSTGTGGPTFPSNQAFTASQHTAELDCAGLVIRNSQLYHSPTVGLIKSSLPPAQLVSFLAKVAGEDFGTGDPIAYQEFLALLEHAKTVVQQTGKSSSQFPQPLAK